jgi:hypothetical protein
MSKKPHKEESKVVKTKAAADDSGFELKENHLWILTAIAFAGFYFYSTKSHGFYQHDEVAHYFNMKSFWSDPSGSMGNWAKFGYKLIYSIPAMLGGGFLVLFNSFVSALSCYFAYKVAEVFNKKLAVLAFVLTATQPLWIELSFRNYADNFSAFMLVLAVYFAVKDKYYGAALVTSYAVLVRQEFAFIYALLGLYLLYKRQILPALSMGIFPLLYCVWTYYGKGDFFYMITEARATSEAYNKEFHRLGFDHYFLMSIAVFGAMQLALVLTFLFQYISSFFNKEIVITDRTKLLFVILPAIIHILVHSAFNAQFMNFGTPTDGNLRYMIAVSPLIGVMCALAFSLLPRKMPLLVFLGFMAFLVGTYLSYQHNNLKFIENQQGEQTFDGKPILFFILGIAMLYVPLKNNMKIIGTGALALIFALVILKPYKYTPEEQSIEKAVNYLVKNKDAENKIVITNHTIVNYFYDKLKGHPLPHQQTLDSSFLEVAPKGTIAIYETHYGFRPNLYKGAVWDGKLLQSLYYYIDPEVAKNPNLKGYFIDNNYTVLFTNDSRDRRFQIAVVEK